MCVLFRSLISESNFLVDFFPASDDGDYLIVDSFQERLPFDVAVSKGGTCFWRLFYHAET